MAVVNPWQLKALKGSPSLNSRTVTPAAREQEDLGVMMLWPMRRVAFNHVTFPKEVREGDNEGHWVCSLEVSGDPSRIAAHWLQGE